MVRQTGNGRILFASFGGFMAGIDERDDSVLQSATTDITGLPGKKEFYQSALKEAREKSEGGDFTAFCPCFFNVTNFRAYNRNCGIEGGDRALVYIAKTLNEEFPGALIGHFTADHFAGILPREDLFDKIREVADKVDSYFANGLIRLKAGIVIFDETMNPGELIHTFDRAETACRAAMTDSGDCYAVYTEEMDKALAKKYYILDSFDEALKNGYIKVYYQPVVRTLTEKVCSFEALARWEDPVEGMLSPGLFIPVLEEARMIGRLDAYIIENAARLIHDRISNGCEMLPVSVNLSRLDFSLMNPLERVEEAVRKYDIPKRYIHVEITETAVAKSSGELEKAIVGFREAGYEVWLDDFGSEYSSLNALHNFDFDMLKIDMGFFRNFNEKGKNIITSVVYMAKQLGIHTLAEGVETREQMEFLKKIGCERIQGYYYGKPEKFENDLMEFDRKGLTFETERSGRILEEAGMVNLADKAPTAIFFFDGKYMQILAANDVYRSELQKEGMDSVDAENEYLSDDCNMQVAHIRTFMQRVYNAPDTYVYLKNDIYMSLHASRIAGDGDGWVGEASLFALSTDRQKRASSRLEALTRHISDFFDGYYYLDLANDQIEVIEPMHVNMSIGETIKGIGQFNTRFANEWVHPDDRERFISFIRPGGIMKTARESGNGRAVDIFRIKTSSGKYHWVVMSAVVIRKSKGNDFILICEHEDLWENKKERAGLLPVFASSFSVSVRTDVSDVKKESEKIPYKEGVTPDRRVSYRRASDIALSESNEALLGIEAWCDDAITMGLAEKNPDEGIKTAIASISENLMAQRFFIFEERDDGTVSCTYEWNARGVPPLKEELSGIPRKDLSPLYEMFADHKVAIIRDFASFIEEHPQMKLPVAGITNIISGRLSVNGEPIGFTMVINSAKERLNANGYMLSTLTNFLAALISHKNILVAETDRSRRDQLTGTLNRTGLTYYFDQRTSVGKVGLITCDIKGLKNINNTSGYDAGDKTLVRVAAVLKRVTDPDHVSRIDGDAFLIIEEDMDDAGIRAVISNITNGCLAEGISIYTSYCILSGEVDKLRFNGALLVMEDEINTQQKKCYCRADQ